MNNTPFMNILSEFKLDLNMSNDEHDGLSEQEMHYHDLIESGNGKEFVERFVQGEILRFASYADLSYQFYKTVAYEDEGFNEFSDDQFFKLISNGFPFAYCISLFIEQKRFELVSRIMELDIEKINKEIEEKCQGCDDISLQEDFNLYLEEALMNHKYEIKDSIAFLDYINEFNKYLKNIRIEIENDEVKLISV